MEALDSLLRKMFTGAQSIYCILHAVAQVHKPPGDRCYLNLVSVEKGMEGWSKLGSKFKTRAVSQVLEEKVMHASVY